MVFGAPATAITGGSPAPDEAPYDAVGQLLLAYEAGLDDGLKQPVHIGFCTGTYVAADMFDHAFLTAAHCTFDADTYPLAIESALASILGTDVHYLGMQVTFDEHPWSNAGRWTLDEHTATIDVAVDDYGNVVQRLGGYGEHPGRQDDRDLALLSLDVDDNAGGSLPPCVSGCGETSGVVTITPRARRIT